jgi:hypothetical protein
MVGTFVNTDQHEAVVLIFASAWKRNCFGHSVLSTTHKDNIQTYLFVLAIQAVCLMKPKSAMFNHKMCLGFCQVVVGFLFM